MIERAAQTANGLFIKLKNREILNVRPNII